MDWRPPLDRFVRTLNRRGSIDPDDVQAILNLPCTAQPQAAFSTIVREGETPRAFTILLTGIAFRSKSVRSGGRQIIGVDFPGEPLDLHCLYLSRADHHVQALTNVVLAVVPRLAMLQLALTRPAISHAFAAYTQIEASIMREWMLNNGRRTSRERVAHLICELAVRLKAQQPDALNGYELPFSQEELGDVLGITSVHVNRMLKLLQGEGLIVQRGRCLRILNWVRLTEVGGFDDRYLQLRR